MLRQAQHDSHSFLNTLQDCYIVPPRNYGMNLKENVQKSSSFRRQEKSIIYNVLIIKTFIPPHYIQTIFSEEK